MGFLRETVGVPLARLIPYDAQLMLLTTFFYHCPVPGPRQVEELTRWFWVTSWSGFFAGANTTQIKQAIQQMRSFARGSRTIMPDANRARPFPNRFDLRGARVRAFIIWELREFPDRLAAGGEKLSAVDILARGATSAYRRVITTPGLAAVSSPANRLIMPTEPRISLRNTLLNLPEDLRDDVLSSHGIPELAWHRLAQNDDEGFIAERRAALAERERTFMAKFGLVADVTEGDTDIDTE